HPPGEGFALDVLRHDEAEAVGGPADVVDGDDGGVVEHGQGAGLGQVAGEVAGVGDEPAVRYLDGDGAVEVLVAGEDDDPERPAAEDGLDLVAAEDGGQLVGAVGGRGRPVGRAGDGGRVVGRGRGHVGLGGGASDPVQ